MAAHRIVHSVFPLLRSGFLATGAVIMSLLLGASTTQAQ